MSAHHVPLPGDSFVEAAMILAGDWADSALVCLARIRAPGGDYLVAGDLASLTWAVYDLDNNKAVAGSGSGSLTPASAVYAALQTGADWTEDSTGYNFKATLGKSNFPKARRRYRIVFTFATTVAENSFKAVYENDTADATG